MKVAASFITILFFTIANGLAQLEFAHHTITDSADDARSVYGIDLDSDGDMDVLSACYSGDNISWYENDGNQNFSSHVITDSTYGANG